ncbi:unnamed protein product [Adineta steineri]|uniref:Uncharacterized protein n=1 Tax=Adineta steineri TaxID=433720 RepID=A0A816E133_9BILA|nr:unnamed protein product [Adineta steineri]CAF1643813.1 unnamed protein product [Adineta steineri]
MMGCFSVKILKPRRGFDKWSWENYPKMLSWSETLREILHLLFSTIRVAGKLPPAGKDLKSTDAAVLLSKVKFSVDRTHFKNHIGHWCRRNMNPDDNKLLENVNTEAAEQALAG